MENRPKKTIQIASRFPRIFAAASRLFVFSGLFFMRLPAAPLAAGEQISFASNEILRSDVNVGGSTAAFTSFELFSDITFVEELQATYSGHDVHPGLGNLITHPHRIGDLTGIQSGAGEITLTWTSPTVLDGFAGATGYYLVRWSSSAPMNSETAFENATRFDQNWVPLVAGGQETFQVTGLAPGNVIYLAVKARDTAGNSGYVSSGPACWQGIFISSRPTLPSGLTVTALSSTSINWSWFDNAGNEDGYRVMAATGGSISGTLPASTTFYVQSGLYGPNTSFSLAVEAFNTFWISSTSVLTGYTLANEPVDLDLVAISTDSVTTRWDRNSNPEYGTDYLLEISTMTDFLPLAQSSATVLTTSTLQNLVPDTSYFYRATALNGGGVASSPTVTISTVTLAAAPSLVSLNIFQTSMTLSWNQDGNPSDTLYTIEISSVPGFAQQPFVHTGILAGSATEFVGLVANTSYYIRAKAANRVGIETDSQDFGTGLTHALTPLSLGYTVKTTSFTASLDANGNPEGTRLDLTHGDFSLANTTSGAAGIGSPSAVLTLDALLPNTTYTFRMRGLGASQAASQPEAIVTTATLAAIPQPGSFPAVGLSSISVQWDLNGAEGTNSAGTEFLAEWSGQQDFSGSTRAAWGAGLSTAAFNLPYNTTHYFRLQARNWHLFGTGYSQTFATSTLAALPGAPAIANVNRSSITVILEVPAAAGNPAYTQFAVYNVVQDSWLQDPSAGESVLGAVPAWHTYAEWGGASGVTNVGLPPDSVFSFQAKARNSLRAETALGPASVSTTTLVGDPEVAGSDPAASVWVNFTTASFTLQGSKVFHYRYNVDSVDLASHDSDPIHFSSHSAVLVTTAAAEGANFLHLRGENSFHSFVANLTYGPILVDTTPPSNVSIVSVTPASFSIILAGSVADDPLSDLVAQPYQYEELTGNAGSIGLGAYQASTNLTDSGLVPNTTYAYQYRAQDVAGNVSPFSASVTTVTLAALPGAGAPSGIFTSSITVTWTNPYSNPSDTRYVLQTSTLPGFTGSTDTLDAFDVTADTLGLRADTSHYFRVKAVSRRNLETAWVDLGSTVTLANAVAFSSISWVGVSSVSFSWSYPANPFDTRYLVEISTDGFAGAVKSSETILNHALIKPLHPSTSYQMRVLALNRLGVVTDAVSVTAFTMGNAVPLEFAVGSSSITISWSAEVAPPGSEYQVKIATLLAGSTSAFDVQPWTQDISEWSFTNLDPNHQYSFEVSWREPPLNEEIFMVSGATRTFAVKPDAPSVGGVGFDAASFVVLPATNPVAAPNETQFAILVTAPGTQDDQRYVPAPVNSISDMTGGSISPFWLTYSQWGGASGIAISNLTGGTIYAFSVKARNGRGVETGLSDQRSVVLFPTTPKINWSAGLAEDSWLNVAVTSFTARNSAHYHYKFVQSSTETLPDSGDDSSGFGPGFANLEVVTVTAAVPGPWYFYAVGDGFGFGTPPNPSHTSVGGNKFKINIDTTTPVISSIAAQFGPNDTTPIADGLETPHREPYFVWDSLDNSDASKASGKVAPITGYSVVFATGTDPGDGAVPDVVVTTRTSAYFPIADKTDRTSNSYYLRVKALDKAGNWGQSRSFVYRLTEDFVQPTAEVLPPSPTTGPDGEYLAASATAAIRIQFSKDMKDDTVLSSENVSIRGIRDNMGNVMDNIIAASMTYVSATRILEVRPLEALPSGWLFEISITTDITDLGGNPLAGAVSARFETLLNTSIENKIVAADGATTVEVPPGAMPEDVTITVSVIYGGASAAPKRWKGATGWHSPQFVSMQAIDSANAKLAARLGSFAQPVSIREFNAIKKDGERLKQNFNLPVTITMPYLDQDGDGTVDGTNPRVSVKNMAVFVLDEANDVWHKLPVSGVYPETKTAKAGVIHFSVYAVLGVPDQDVSKSYAYPVPFRPGRGDAKITFASLPSFGRIRVYTASGEKVKEILFVDPNGSKLEWDVTNSDGEDLARGVYLYIVESGDNRKTGKLMVIK